MNNVLVINGHEYYEHSKGDLNKTLFEEIVKKLTSNYKIKTTILQDGFEKHEEQDKVKWADTIIYQTPIYNYNVPALFKKYFDETHEYGVYFRGSKDDYGKGGGLLSGKKYMFSTTWNAPSNAFNDRNQFFEGRSVEDVLFPLHLTHKYVGMEYIKTFSCFNVKKNPNIQQYANDLHNHLIQYLKVKL